MLELRDRDGGRSLPLLELDPDLGRMLSPDRRTEATNSLIVRTQNLQDGLLDLARLQTISPSHIGLLVIDGVIAEEVVLGDSVSTELLGSGDVIRPWTAEEPVELLETEVRWTVLSEVTAALLDRRVAIELCRYPEVYSTIVDRLSQRSARLATMKAISQMTRVDRRLIALFWHLAERWGRMTAQGLRIPCGSRIVSSGNSSAPGDPRSPPPSPSSSGPGSSCVSPTAPGCCRAIRSCRRQRAPNALSGHRSRCWARSTRWLARAAVAAPSAPGPELSPLRELLARLSHRAERAHRGLATARRRAEPDVSAIPPR